VVAGGEGVGEQLKGGGLRMYVCLFDSTTFYLFVRRVVVFVVVVSVVILLDISRKRAERTTSR